jgi:hypothetical protein
VAALAAEATHISAGRAGNRCPDCEIASKSDPTCDRTHVIDSTGEPIFWVGSRVASNRDPAKFRFFATRSMRWETLRVGSLLEAILLVDVDWALCHDANIT